MSNSKFFFVFSQQLQNSSSSIVSSLRQLAVMTCTMSLSTYVLRSIESMAKEYDGSASNWSHIAEQRDSRKGGWENDVELQRDGLNESI